MKRYVAIYLAKCLTCHMTKVEHKRAIGELHPLDIPEWKKDNISMDFVYGLPKTKQNCDDIWVIVDRLKKSSHFIPFNMKHMKKIMELTNQE